MRTWHVAALVLTVWSAAASGEPLGKEACEKLQEELRQLGAAGVRNAMANGPEWAKANLPPEKLQEIARLIEVDAQLAFRCLPPKPLPQAAEAPAGGEQHPAKARPKMRTKAAAVQPAAAQPAAAAQAGAAAPEQGGEGEAQPAKPQPRRAPAKKPKTNDAYVPAPPVGNALTGQGQ